MTSNKKIKLGMNKPISKDDRQDFLNESPDMVSAKNISKTISKVGRPKLDPSNITVKKTITMYQEDLDLLDDLINRTIKLGQKDKGLSGTIRMGLAALNKLEDNEFIEIYSKIK
ncbi:hypothetical protein IB642_06490 [Allofrancisella guangzhouensis]|uniref:hypothetical protein n=3 Tax=Pseudomonadota TaxID=1224 RepID=UPI0012AE71E2|nr:MULTISPECIES: hypothetical protein [Pseudomonadota]MBK2044669.1 hypothetical protein [Allofrancisella guangzhouensis]MBK2045699.1 hypothetical protein [Allofrancisella guangzhouensis]MRN79931.1 hypothetical protein [Brucella sp. 10RB9210]